MKRLWFAALAGLLVLLGSAGSAQAVLIATDWAISGAPSRLYSINTVTGNVTTIGITGQPRMIGLVVDFDNTIYSVSEEGNSGLWRLNPTTGAATLVGRLGFNLQEGDMTIDPVSREMFVSDGAGDRLYRVNRATGAATLVGPYGTPGRDVSGLQFIGGVLYGLALRDGAPDALIRVDPSSGAATTIGNTGTNFGVIMGMGLDPDTGVIYIAGPTTDFGSNNQLWRLNLATGAATLERNLTGIAASLSGFSNATAAAIVPEPGTLAIGTVTVLGLLGYGWRRRKTAH